MSKVSIAGTEPKSSVATSTPLTHKEKSFSFHLIATLIKSDMLLGE